MSLKNEQQRMGSMGNKEWTTKNELIEQQRMSNKEWAQRATKNELNEQQRMSSTLEITSHLQIIESN